MSAQDVLVKAREVGGVTPSVVYRAMLRLYSNKMDKPGYGDKDPRAVEFLPIIAAALPGVHIVHVVRDPRDILASKKKAEWSRGHGVLWHAFASRVQLRMGRRNGFRLLNGRYHELIYERLLVDPEGELKKLCKNLGLCFESSMLNFGQSARRIVFNREMSWKEKTLGPLLPKNFGKWQTQLADWETALIELVCMQHFRVGGYERSYCISRLNIGRRLAVYSMAALIVVADPLYRLYRTWMLRRAKKYL